MALWVCGGKAGCGTKYAVGLFRCPRCHNTAFYEDGDPMAKITRHGGASDKTLPTPDAAAVEPDPTPATAADQAEAEQAEATVVDLPGGAAFPSAVEEEGGEEPSPGSSSSASTETPQTSSEPSNKTRPRRARMTASRSAKDRTENSSARSTDGDPETGTSTADSE